MELCHDPQHITSKLITCISRPIWSHFIYFKRICNHWKMELEIVETLEMEFWNRNIWKIHNGNKTWEMEVWNRNFQKIHNEIKTYVRHFNPCGLYGTDSGPPLHVFLHRHHLPRQATASNEQEVSLSNSLTLQLRLCSEQIYSSFTALVLNSRMYRSTVIR